MGVLKVELHSHTADDPCDAIPHTTFALIDRAAALGYDALAVTLHDRQLPLAPYERYARERSLVLIQGIERTIEGKHVLLLNLGDGAEQVRTFADLARLKGRERGLVVAPHPFYPSTSALWGRLTQHASLFDAVECNAMFTSRLNFNTRAERWARAYAKPIVGNGDVHRLEQLGTTYSLVDAEADPDAICEAIRAGRVRVKAQPLSMWTAARILGDMFASDVRRELWPRQPAADPA